MLNGIPKDPKKIRQKYGPTNASGVKVRDHCRRGSFVFTMDWAGLKKAPFEARSSLEYPSVFKVPIIDGA